MSTTIWQIFGSIVLLGGWMYMTHSYNKVIQKLDDKLTDATSDLAVLRKAIVHFQAVIAIYEKSGPRMKQTDHDRITLELAAATEKSYHFNA